MSDQESKNNTELISKKKPGLKPRCLLLSLCGSVISAYLLYHHVALRSGALAGPSICNLGGSFDCDAVALSSFSELFGVPLGGYGLIYYLTLILLAWFLAPDPLAGQSHKASYSDSMFFLSALSLPPTIFLAFVSIVYLGKVCLFCSLLYLINILLILVCYFDSHGSGSVIHRLICGAKNTYAYFFTPENARTAAPVTLGLLLAGALVCYSPTLLANTVLKQSELDQQLQATIDSWRSAPVVDLPIRIDEGLADKDFSMGDSSPKLTIVEFSDFQCPMCRRISPFLKKAVSENSSVRLVFKNYPLDASCRDGNSAGMHKLACQAAILARCAGLQGDKSFWQMHDGLFALEGYQWSVEKLLSLPEELGLDADALLSCQSESRTKDRVKEDVRLGDRLKITGTPTIFVNGRKLRLIRLEHLPKVISRILREE